MTRHISLSLALLLLLTSSLSAQSRSSELRAAQSVVKEVDRGVKKRLLVRSDTTVACGDGLQTHLAVWRDRNGTIRRLRLEGGTEDHAETIDYIYDAGGHLRSLHAQLNAVNGTRETRQISFSSAGSVVSSSRRVKGPGYPFGEVVVVARPAEWLRNPCE